MKVIYELDTSKDEMTYQLFCIAEDMHKALCDLKTLKEKIEDSLEQEEILDEINDILFVSRIDDLP